MWKIPHSNFARGARVCADVGSFLHEGPFMGTHDTAAAFKKRIPDPNLENYP